MYIIVISIFSLLYVRTAHGHELTMIINDAVKHTEIL